MASGLLVEQFDGDGEIGLGFAGLGLFGIHQVEELFAVFGEALEGGVGVGGDAQELADQAFAGRGLAAGGFRLQVLRCAGF